MLKVGWDDVRFFVALAGAGGLEKAAEVLGVSHVTVMRRVRTLEMTLGVNLFVRRHDGHRLTATGAELLRACREGGQLIDEALRHAASSQAASRPVRITTTEIVANWILLPYLARAGALLPLEIDASPLERSLLDEEATIAIRFRRPSKGPFRIRQLGTISVTLYAAAAVNDVTQLGYIGWASGFEEIGLSRWLRRCFADARPTLALTTIEGHRSAAVSGVGIAALPRFVADADPRLKPVMADAEPLTLTAWLTLPQVLAARRDTRDAVRLIAAAFGAAGLS